ncbi:lipid a 3-o-deacylase (pagl) [Lucifera butyrica]|uniref:Lipid a 3-o-deacylase (Pagl) n=1 Tax=Lucifera butyrica TaxID=1351585 RepID=A0A498R0A2_9FIRM|nr:acyloxyacyl hydrolase [Lucifera butyrica]VBB05936.1 lipid a 3-o-deacylase (pagl) [Lucifera butyrica]
MVRRLIYIGIVISFLLMWMPETSYCYAADSKTGQDNPVELDWDYLTHVHFNDRYIDTGSLHILEKISEKNNRSVYRGITITRPHGHIIDDNHQTQDSSAVGVGPVYMIRNEKQFSGKLYGAFDMSGGFIVYDKAFPAGGRCYNFMWRFGPRLIYKISEDSSVNIGYLFMHVSNGFRSHNPGYNARGVSLGFVTKF